MSPRRTDAGLWLLAVSMALLVGPGAPLYWDSFGYVTQAFSGRVGGLLLGRPLFILVSHTLALGWHAAGRPSSQLEALLRTAWLVFSALGAPATARLVRAMGHPHRAALWAGAAVACSPATAHTADAVLTDVPSMTAAVIATALAARCITAPNARTALASGVALGVAVGLREQAVLHTVPLAALGLILPRSQRFRLGVWASAGAFVAFSLPVVTVLATQPGYQDTVRAWFTAMAHENRSHPWGLRDLWAWVVWVLALGPAVVVAAGAFWLSPRRRAGSPAGGSLTTLAVCVPAAVQLVLLARYQDIAYSPRYLLAAFPGAVAVPAGLVLAPWAHTRGRAITAACMLVVPALVAAPVLHARQGPLVAALRTLPDRLRTVPPDAAVVTGQLCPAVVYRRAVARADPARWPGPTPAWQQVCPGWRWPRDLPATLDGIRASGRVVVLDLRPVAWVGPRQQHALETVRAYAAARSGSPGVTVWQ